MTGGVDRRQRRHLLAAPELQDYVEALAKSPHSYLETIRADAENHKWNFMLTSRDQAAFLHSCARMTRANKILEIGTYFGHSAVAMAAALPEDGHLYTIEHNPKFARSARDHFDACGLGDKITIITAEAPAAIRSLVLTEAQGSFDLVFIDADKKNFSLYWESALTLTRKGGAVIFDNVLARGDILDTSADAAPHIAAVRDFNQLVFDDPRAFSSVATIGDGMILAVKL